MGIIMATITKKKTAKKSKSKSTSIQTKGKKKRAVARLRLKEGKESVKINGVPLEIFSPVSSKRVIEEPIIIAKQTLGDKVLEKADIDINVSGGGSSGQAYACRTAVGKAIVEWTKNDDLKKVYLDYDRSLLISDVRVKEPKKCLRKGARAKPTKSYR